MSVKDGDMWGALTITDLTYYEIDVLCEASGRVDAGEDGRDFFKADRDAGTVIFMGNLDALRDAIDAIAKEHESPWSDHAHEASKKYHEVFTNTFEGPT